MTGKVKDCGCGGGKNCITKAKSIAAFKEAHPQTRLTGKILAAKAVSWSKKEMEKLDCGCGCKGLKGFARKYLKGGKLNDCPPGFDNHGLTCLERCGPDEFDDGLTCRKKCGPGLIDDGLTCRRPITSSMNSCPPGSRDIAGTCWGPVRKDCVDDCFKHPAPGCRTWQCGRLRGLFGEDWGPKLCTSCNLRCGQTCWDVQGITKQLHQRNLQVQGGEVTGQAIRGKRIIGRVNWEVTMSELKNVLKDAFSDDGALARAFDPAKNGVNEAFRKFGENTEAAFKAIGEKIQKGFEEMGDAAKAAFEDLGRRMKADFEKLGVDIMHKLKDPYFWADFVTYAVMAATVILTAAATVATGGLAAPAMPGLLAAAAMIGPAIRMTADSINGKPLDALAVASFALSVAACFVPAAGPGMSIAMKKAISIGGAVIKAGEIAVGLAEIARDAGYIDTCIVNCPGKPGPPPPPPPPPLPPADPPKPKKTDKEIEEILKTERPCCLVKQRIRGPGGTAIDNPARCETLEDCIDKWRADNEGLVDPDDDEEEKVEQAKEEMDADDPFAGFPAVSETPATVDSDDPFAGFPAVSEMPPTVDSSDPFAGFPAVSETPPTVNSDDPWAGFPAVSEMPPTVDSSSSGGRRGGAVASLEDAVVAERVGDREFKNPWTMEMAGIANPNQVPPGKDGRPFNPECYAKNYPDLAKSLNNDMTRLTVWWNDIGHKKGEDPSCGAFIPKSAEEEERQKTMRAAAKVACDAGDAFWTGTNCDVSRNADGSKNTAAEECKQSGSWWDFTASPRFCNRYRNLDNNLKKPDESCNSFNNFWTGTACDESRNVDGIKKSEGDLCTGLNNFWTGITCDVTKDKTGSPKNNERMCHDLDGYYKNGNCDLTKNTKNQQKDWRHQRQASNCPDYWLEYGQIINNKIQELERNGATPQDIMRFRRSLSPSKPLSIENCNGPYPTDHKQMEEYLASRKGKFKKQYDEVELERIKAAFESGNRVFRTRTNIHGIAELASPTSWFGFASMQQVHARHPKFDGNIPTLADDLITQLPGPPAGSGKLRQRKSRS